MGKSTAKKRRRRERKRLAERARQSSLLDLASPPLPPPPEPGAIHNNDNSFNNYEHDEHGKTQNGGYHHSGEASSSSQLHGGGSAMFATTMSSNGPLSPMPAGPKEASWKRLEFVFPRSMNSEPFIFEQQRQQQQQQLQQRQQGTTGVNSEATKNANKVARSTQELEKKNNETIDDILSSNKTKTNGHRQPTIKPPTTAATAVVDDSNKVNGGRRRNLELAFEAVRKEESKGKADINSFVDVPKKKKAKRQHAPDVPTTPTAHDDKDAERAAHAEHSNGVPIPDKISGRSVEEAVRDKPGLRPRANSTDGELNLPQRGLCDERMVLEAHRWDLTGNVIGHQKFPRGFQNLGNTCFLNATLQCLAYLPPFCQTLIRIWENKMRNEHNETNGKIFQGQRITSHLCSLFQKTHGMKGGQNHGGALSPSQIAKALPLIGTCGSRNGYKFHLGRQEDAHEFLVHLLDAMNDGELRAAGINQHASGWRDRLPVPRLDETTFIHRIFGGYFRSQVRCQKCGYRSNTYDPFLDLSLEVSKKSSTSVLNALSEFTRKETLDAENRWKCSGCKNYVCATKQLTVFRPPLSLCIQLKRFSFDGGFGGSSFYGMGGYKFSNFKQGRGGSKITKPIHFPAQLDLPLSDGRSCSYTLTGIVIHVGGSASSGHYTACVRKIGRDGSTRWYSVDDGSVEPVSEKSVLRQNDAYILFYCRKEVKLEFPSPPPRSMSADEARELGRARARARTNSFSEENPKPSTAESQEKQRAETEFGTVATRESKTIREASDKNESARNVEMVKTKEHPLSSPRTAGESTSVKSTNGEANVERNGDHRDVAAPKTSDESRHFKESQVSTTYKTKNDDKSDDSSESGSSTSNSTSSSDSGDSQSVKETPVVAKILTKDAFNKAKKRENEEESSSDEESSSSSSNSGSDDDDSSAPSSSNDGSSESESDSKKTPASSRTAKGINKPENRTRVVINKSDLRGKVKVMLGPLKKSKTWTSKASPTASASKGTNFHLLGTMPVQRWGDEDGDGNDEEGRVRKASAPLDDRSGPGTYRSQEERRRIVQQLEEDDRSRKRYQYSDRWDASLDQGRLKKVKSSKGAGATGDNPNKNAFQRIQAGLRKMRGKPKGHFPPRKGGHQKGKRGNKKTRYSF